MIGIIDYGMGNLKSVEKAFAAIGEQAFISASAQELSNADRLILPGVGAFDDALAALNQSGLTELIRQAVSSNVPLLGICLGMQLLLDSSEETQNDTPSAGLGLIPGRVVRIPAKEGFKIPQIGWNNLNITKREPLFSNLPESPYVYFVHSYHLKTEAPIVSATVSYGKEIQVAAQQKNVYALQFHPEKSGDVGLEILKNFGGF